MRTQRVFAIGVEGRAATPPDPLAALLPAGTPRYLQSPRLADDLERIGPTDRVLVLGAGLAALGAVLELDDQGHRAPIRLVASHGLWPLTQRLMPSAVVRLSALLSAGRLEVYAGSIGGAAAYDDTIVVDVLPRGRKTHVSERYDWIVNGAGSFTDTGLRAEH